MNYLQFKGKIPGNFTREQIALNRGRFVASIDGAETVFNNEKDAKEFVVNSKARHAYVIKSNGFCISKAQCRKEKQRIEDSSNFELALKLFMNNIPFQKGTADDPPTNTH